MHNCVFLISVLEGLRYMWPRFLYIYMYIYAQKETIGPAYPKTVTGPSSKPFARSLLTTITTHQHKRSISNLAPPPSRPLSHLLLVVIESSDSSSHKIHPTDCQVATYPQCWTQRNSRPRLSQISQMMCDMLSFLIQTIIFSVIMCLLLRDR